VNQEENVKVHQTGHSEVSEGDLGLKEEDLTWFLTHRRVKLFSGACQCVEALAVIQLQDQADRDMLC